ncbi:MAG: FtsQ-type POTRA domain-containing protein, partial [Atopobiaceae bacterium]|nr:FtsQ-type POTRA domain-containing protein [Atopobiaceae bacterium]
AGVVEGTTLLSVDEEVVEQNLMRNPWVAEVHVRREFPDKLGIEVRERQIDSLVLMSTSAFAWYIGEGNVWLEPATLDISDGQTAKDAAQALAIAKGAIFIIDAPATVNPQAGGEVTDDVLLAIDTYRRELPEEISSQVVYFSASSLEGISCVLTSGVEVSLGNPTQIEQKAAVLTQILEQYPGEITYVNVREPSTPAYRRIDSGTVQPGSGA